MNAPGQDKGEELAKRFTFIDSELEAELCVRAYAALNREEQRHFISYIAGWLRGRNNGS